MSEPTFLGVPDVQIEKNEDMRCSWSTNKFGGRPNWMHNSPENHPTCGCGRQLLLVSQIYCPITTHYHRTIYIFGCANTSCWNQQKGWRVIRSQVKAESSQQEIKENKVLEKGSSVDDWCADAGEWGDVDDWDVSSLCDLATATSKLTINTKETNEIPTKTNQPSMPNSCNVPWFHPYYVSVFEDTTTYKETSKASLTAHEKELLLRYKEHEKTSDVLQSSKRSNEHTTEKYEKTSVAHGDEGFYRFHKYIQSCPKQCIRYQWNGTLVSISAAQHTDIVSMVPNCQYCGSERVFELQLMPALVALLSTGQSSLLSPSEVQLKDSRGGCICPGNGAESCCFGDTEGRLPGKDGCSRRDREIVHGTKNTGSSNSLDCGENLCAASTDGTREQQEIEFGTVMVFSCSQSCWEDNLPCSYREEFAIIEADPDANMFLNKV